MDFGSLLHVAQKNEKLQKPDVKYYSTKFEPPKKEERSKQLSSNIKKFLARKEAEEKQIAKEAKNKKEELLALRSQDRKATRRVAVMLKRTKSANKSVIFDAIDNDNTAVTLAGPSQPDEDDYGYVSQEASAYYNKMMAKYSTTPDEEKFPRTKKNTNTNLVEIKDRVRAALLREQEEALLPHRRKRKPKETDMDDFISKDDEIIYITQNKDKPAKPKPRSAAPPPLNFNDLLKIAEKKQFEPIKIEPKVVPKDDVRPMTKKQRKEYEKEKAWRDKKGLTSENTNQPSGSSDKLMPPPMKIPKLNSNSSNGRIPKLSSSDERPRIPKSSSSEDRPLQRPASSENRPPQRPTSSQDRPPQRPSNPSKPPPRRPDERMSIPKREDKPAIKRSDDRNGVPKRIDEKTNVPKKSSNGVQNHSASSDRRPDPNKISKLRNELEKNRSLNNKPPSRLPNNPNLNNKSQSMKPATSLDKNKTLVRKDINGKPSLQNGSRPKQFPPADLKPKQFPPSDLKPKQFPPSDLKPKQFPPPDVRRKFPSKDVKRKQPMGHKRRILDDDDSEYDSEMDDFIDDGAGEAEDYSKYISEIFGYDKSRYRQEDFDDHEMESSFSQVMKEEFLSSKIGLMEDLEDMKQEAEEKKKKAIRMKGRK